MPHRRFAIPLAAGLALAVASSAHAITPFLTLNGCPGDPGAVRQGSLECANGSTVALMVTAEAGANFDMFYFEVSLNFALTSEDYATAPYWDFGATGTAGCPKDVAAFPRNMTISTDKFGSCADWLNAFGNNAYVSALERTSSSTTRMVVGKSNFGTVPVTVGQKLFLCSIVFDAAHVGTCPGCAAQAVVAATGAFAEDHSTFFHDTSGPGPFDSVTIDEDIVPVQRQTWGRLKQLYR
jgi:hypothetical protein